MAMSPSSPKESHQFKFRGTHVPVEIHRLLRDKKITTTEFVLLAVVDSLVDEEEGCWASNAYLANRLSKSEEYVRSMLRRLRKQKLIKHVGWKKIGEKHFRVLETAWSKISPSVVAGNHPSVVAGNHQSNNTTYSYKEERVSPDQCYLDDADSWHRLLSKQGRLPPSGKAYRKTNAESFRLLKEVDGVDYLPWVTWYCSLTQKEVDELKLPNVPTVKQLRNPTLYSWIMNVWRKAFKNTESSTNGEDNRTITEYFLPNGEKRIKVKYR